MPDQASVTQYSSFAPSVLWPWLRPRTSRSYTLSADHKSAHTCAISPELFGSSSFVSSRRLVHWPFLHCAEQKTILYSCIKPLPVSTACLEVEKAVTQAHGCVEDITTKTLGVVVRSWNSVKPTIFQMRCEEAAHTRRSPVLKDRQAWAAAAQEVEPVVQ